MKTVTIYDQGYRCSDRLYAELKRTYLNYKHCSTEEGQELAKREYEKAMSNVMTGGKSIGQVHGSFTYDILKPYFIL